MHLAQMIAPVPFECPELPAGLKAHPGSNITPNPHVHVWDGAGTLPLPMALYPAFLAATQIQSADPPRQTLFVMEDGVKPPSCYTAPPGYCAAPHCKDRLHDPRLHAVGAVRHSVPSEGTLHKAKALFAVAGYAVVPDVVVAEFLDAMVATVSNRIAKGHLVLGDKQTAHRYWALDDDVAHILLQGLVPLVSQLAGRGVRPTYSYLVMYTNGSTLPKHTDKGECEYSVSLLLDYSPAGRAQEWPMHLHYNDSYKEVWWAPGSALAYRGMEIPHSRGRLPQGHSSINVFLHYVSHNSTVGKHRSASQGQNNS